MRKIMALCQADGWWSVRKIDKEDGGGFAYRKVACWAAVEDNESHEGILGFEGGDYMECCEEVKNFWSYMHESEMSDEIKNEIRNQSIGREEGDY